MTWDELCELASELPGTTVDLWYGTPAFKVNGKGYVRIKEDGVVVFVLPDLDVQDALIASNPAVYYITDHYVGWPAVLARLAALAPGEARDRLEQAWRTKAKKAQLAELAAVPAKKPAKKRARAK